jgi:1-acyl-sn-glycerol-3-phosphate acyltransferase
MKCLLLNATFYTLFFVASLVMIPVLSLLVCLGAPFVSTRRTMSRFRRGISWYGTLVIRVCPFPFVRVKYRDLGERCLPGACLFVCNHRSASDPFLMACMPYECIQIVNVWPFRLPVLGRYAKWAGYLSVNELPVEEFYDAAAALLAENVSVISFPEGTRSGGREMGQFRGAVFRLALREEVPIVPICISGNENIPHKGSPWLQPGLVRVHKLPAVTWDEYKELSAFQLKNRIRDIIAGHLAEMEDMA